MLRRGSITVARRALAGLCLAAAAAAPAGCAVPGSYAGIPLSSGAADPDLQAVAARARRGDKQAQLELGIRYEEGRGLPADLDKARRLYAQAAADSGGILHVYSPPMGKVPGRVIQIARPRVAGLEEARRRLEGLGHAR